MKLLHEFKQLLSKFGLEYFDKYYGHYRGIVADNNDPEKSGKLKLKVPQLYGDTVFDYWAFPAGIPNGNQAISAFIPKVGDMVWVFFENGDPSYPVWMFGNLISARVPESVKQEYPNTYGWVTTAGAYCLFRDANQDIIIREQQGQTGISISYNLVTLGTDDSSNVNLQPVILGDRLIEKIEALCDYITDLSNQCAAITVTPASLGVPTPPPNNAPAFAIIAGFVSNLKVTFTFTKSNIVKTI